MEIKIENYLNTSEIKEVLIDELRIQVREHFKNEENAKRLLSNIAYQIIQDEIDKIIPNHKDVLVKKVAELINEKIDFNVFYYDYLSHEPKSLGAKIVTKTIKDNQELIKSKVIESITNKDYSEEAWNKFESLAESFTHNVYDFVEAMREKTKSKLVNKLL